MPTPPRPEGLPSDATWNEEESTWYVGTHDGETKTGAWTWWRHDG